MKLFCRKEGHGPAVILLHGLFGLSDNWVTFARALGKDYTVYIPDLRNHGQSPHSALFDFPSMEQDILELAEENGLDHPIVIGHSLGGKLAMYLALHYPQMVKSLVVVDISLRKSPPSGEHQSLINAMLAVDFAECVSRSDVERQLRPMVESEKLRQFLLKNVYWRERDKLDWRLNLKAINEQLAVIWGGVSDTGVYPGPALFIRGGRSGYVLDGDMELIKKRFPGAELVTLADAGHWVHADAPGEFFVAVRDFLDR